MSHFVAIFQCFEQIIKFLHIFISKYRIIPHNFYSSCPDQTVFTIESRGMHPLIRHSSRHRTDSIKFWIHIPITQEPCSSSWKSRVLSVVRTLSPIRARTDPSGESLCAFRFLEPFTPQYTRKGSPMPKSNANSAHSPSGHSRRNRSTRWSRSAASAAGRCNAS